MRGIAAFTAAAAPARRKVSSPSPPVVEPIQQLADKGSGCPAHSFNILSAFSWEIWQRKVAVAAGLGKTLTEASNKRASVPKEPGSKRETSYPATFFITFPPKERSWPLPSIMRAPNTKSRKLPTVIRPGPASPAAIAPPKVAFSPKCGGSKAST